MYRPISGPVTRPPDQDFSPFSLSFAIRGAVDGRGTWAPRHTPCTPGSPAGRQSGRATRIRGPGPPGPVRPPVELPQPVGPSVCLHPSPSCPDACPIQVRRQSLPRPGGHHRRLAFCLPPQNRRPNSASAASVSARAAHRRASLTGVLGARRDCTGPVFPGASPAPSLPTSLWVGWGGASPATGAALPPFAPKAPCGTRQGVATRDGPVAAGARRRMLHAVSSCRARALPPRVSHRPPRAHAPRRPPGGASRLSAYRSPGPTRAVRSCAAGRWRTPRARYNW